MEKLKRTKVGTALIIAVIIISRFGNVQAQELSFEKDDKILRLGVGFGAGFYTGIVDTPPVQANFEYAVTDVISLGQLLDIPRLITKCTI